MRTDLLDYHLPAELIAQTPAEPRDSSKLLLCPRFSGDFSTRIFSELPDLLHPGDILVVNEAKVMPGRLFGYKFPSGAKIEALLLEEIAGESDSHSVRFKALLKRQRRLEPGDTIHFPESRLVAEILESGGESGENILEMRMGDDCSGVHDEIEKIGRLPLPPYITDYKGDLGRYQTVYAKVPGSVAAPTAGLHFTDEVFKRLESRGIEKTEVHLRVGWGTFSPIRSENLEEHSIHAEYGRVTPEAASKINECRKKGGRVVAVGTTVTRILETASDNHGKVHTFEGPTGLFITPGYRFKA
ncbi:MAG TPA: tRNA preQ1(34) S-adenosylmethionine ribosyltransferase-isomerase QueA, partial [Firmicutes bacterium]|nr:tRNA preQ1(34) S-adenosylmethionine ribosyltransferase-isomerase QueA [Bacillota bacterium]